MAGIYIHIPFCKKACHYCDFHFSTSGQYKDEMVSAILSELKLQKHYLNGETIETIYLGGGTPSLLSADEIKMILNLIYQLFEVSENPEITLEANPDDLNPQKVDELRQTLINRFSIGIQSFYEDDLFWMNRSHNSKEAESAIKRIQDAGYENLTIDLIYGYPLLSDEKWMNNIFKAVSFSVPHISAYSITVEPATALASFINKGRQAPMNEAQSAEQFLTLMRNLEAEGFEHYEISNFAKPGQYSRHNSNYWSGRSYLGIGPSAHSFKDNTRQWNISNNTVYINSIGKGIIPFEIEILTEANRVNEYIMTSLRTAKGLDLQKIKSHYEKDYVTNLLNDSLKFFENNWLEQKGDIITLTTNGKLYADHIASELFVE